MKNPPDFSLQSAGLLCAWSILIVFLAANHKKLIRNRGRRRHNFFHERLQSLKSRSKSLNVGVKNDFTSRGNFHAGVKSFFTLHAGLHVGVKCLNTPHGKKYVGVKSFFTLRGKKYAGVKKKNHPRGNFHARVKSFLHPRGNFHDHQRRFLHPHSGFFAGISGLNTASGRLQGGAKSSKTGDTVAMRAIKTFLTRMEISMPPKEALVARNATFCRRFFG